MIAESIPRAKIQANCVALKAFFYGTNHQVFESVYKLSPRMG